MNKWKNIGLALLLFAILAFANITMLVIFKISAPPEFYASFAGALAALVFSSLLSYYFWRMGKKQNKDTKAQVIQTLLVEVELNLNNIATFIKGCRSGNYFQAFGTAVMQRNLFWPRFLTDFPHPSFELTQLFDSIYSAFYVIEHIANDIRIHLPEECRFIPMISPSDSPTVQNAIRGEWQKRFFEIQFGVKTVIGQYDKILNKLQEEYKEYTFEKQLHFKDNKTYDILQQFSTII